MPNPIVQLGSILRRPRFNFNQALFLFAVPVAFLMFAQSKRRNAEIVTNIVGARHKLNTAITLLTPNGEQAVESFSEYAQVILSIPMPAQKLRQYECFGAGRGMLLLAWMEIASGRAMSQAVELGRFSAIAALDASIEAHPKYKNKNGFKARLELFSERATPDFLSSLSKSSGYPVKELLESIKALATTRNITGHCKERSGPETRLQSVRVDLRPLHLASAILSALDSSDAS